MDALAVANYRAIDVPRSNLCVQARIFIRVYLRSPPGHLQELSLEALFGSDLF